LSVCGSIARPRKWTVFLREARPLTHRFWTEGTLPYTPMFDPAPMFVPGAGRSRNDRANRLQNGVEPVLKIRVVSSTRCPSPAIARQKRKRRG
jgi:hypothetical protein